MSSVLLFTGLFERAVALDKSWEKGYFSFAVYLDQLMRDARQRQTALTASSRTSAKPMDRLGGRSRHASLTPPNHAVSYNIAMKKFLDLDCPCESILGCCMIICILNGYRLKYQTQKLA